jgi:putative ABC transport system permease protein
VRQARLLALRALRARPLRTILSTFGIILGVASVMAVGVTNATTIASVGKFFNDTSGRSDLVVISADSNKPSLPGLSLERARSYPGVQTVVPSVQVRTILADQSSAEGIGFSMLGATASGLQLYGIDPERDSAIRVYTLTAGRFLRNDLEAYELVLVDSYADKNKLRVGADVSVTTPTGPQRLRLVGLISEEGPARANNGAFGVMPMRTAQKLFGREDRPDQLDILVDPAVATPESLDSMRQELQDLLGNKVSVTHPAGQGQRVNQMLSSYQMGLNMLGAMSIFVGAFLIYNAFSMSVVERTREIGFQRTIGMTKGQIFGQVLIEAVLLGIVGASLGIALGIGLSFGLTGAMGVMIAQDLGTPQVPPDTFLISAGLGLGVTLFGALIPALQAGGISPLAALRSRGGRPEGWLMKYSWLIGGVLVALAVMLMVANPFSYEVRMQMTNAIVFTLFLGGALLVPVTIVGWERVARPAMSLFYGAAGGLGSGNIRRSKLRTTLTVAALMIGVTMIVETRAMGDMFKDDLGSWISSYLGGDLFVTSSLPMQMELGNRLTSVEGVVAAAPMSMFNTRYVSPDGDLDLTFTAIDPTVHGQVAKLMLDGPEMDQGQLLARLAQGDAVLISAVVAEKYHLQIGDTITLKTARGPHDFEIIAKMIDWNNMGMTVEGSWGDMRRYYGMHTAYAFMIKVAPGYDIEEVRQRIDEQYADREHITVEANASLLGRVLVTQAQIMALFDVMAIISLIVASLGVVNTLMMSVVERTQEIGMLRSVGLTRGQVVMMVLSEAAVMGLAGGVLGAIFGLALSSLFMTSMAAVSGYKVSYVFPTQGLIIGLTVAWIVSQIAAILPSRRASRLNILEAIHYE